MASYHDFCGIPSCGGIILVVDNMPIFRRLISRALEARGYRVALAENGQVAVDALAEIKPDLVVMDIAMPVMDGLEATRRIRVLDGAVSRTPIVGFSGQDEFEDREKCLEAGMNDFVSKCGGAEVLIAAVEECMAAVTIRAAG